MREFLGAFQLKNCHKGEYEDVELYTPIGEQNIKDYESKWLPLIEKRNANLSKDEDAESVNIEDAHWKWREKTFDRTDRMDFKSFCVECDGDTQGMMFVRNIAFAREPSQSNQHLIYIDMISSAPWNRPRFTKNRLYEGVGPLLLGSAISYSIEEGFGGRIGLHSLPQSESWYRDECGMTDLGIDLAYPQYLRYFEMTSEQAQIYITT